MVLFRNITSKAWQILGLFLILSFLIAGCSDSNGKKNAGDSFLSVTFTASASAVDAAAGSIITYAGDGTQGDDGDGHHRTGSWLNQPMGLAFDSNDRAYLVDWNNHRIRRVKTTDDSLETVIGQTLPGDWPCVDPTDAANCDVPLTGTLTGADLPLNHPTDLLFATEGATEVMYMAAWHNHKIEKYNPGAGTVTVVSGQMKPGFSGDGGDATAALLSFPVSIVRDSAGNLFEADQKNNRVRRIAAADGTIITVVGANNPPATSGYGDGGDATAALLGIAPYNDLGGIDNPPPGGGIAMDGSGNLYIADTFNHCIRKVTADGDGIDGDSGETIRTFAGSCTVSGAAASGVSLTAARFNAPFDLAFGSDGKLYVSDTGNNVVRAINMTNETISTVAGTGTEGSSGDGGPAASAELRHPYGIAFDSSGALYIADRDNNKIRKVLAADASVLSASVSASTAFGKAASAVGRRASAAVTGYEWDFEDDGTFDETTTTDTVSHVYAEEGNYRARVRVTDDGGQVAEAVVSVALTKVSDPFTGSSGTILTISGTGERGTDPVVVGGSVPASQSRLDQPVDMTMGPDGRLYMMDWNGHKIRALDSSGNVTFVAGTGVEGDACENPNSDGTCPATSSEVNHPTDVTFDSSGRMVVSAWHNAKVKRVDFNADLTSNLMADLCGTGNRKFEGEGLPCDNPTTGADQVSFDLPTSVAFDSEGNLFISDSANMVIRKMVYADNAVDRVVKTVAGNCPGTTGFGCLDGQGYDGDNGPATSAHLNNSVGQSTDPQGKIAFGPDGSLYIADSANNVIRRVSPGTNSIIGDSGDESNEAIATVVGQNPGTGSPATAGYAGENDPATEAVLNGPRDVKVAADGALYIADTLNNCIRRIDPGADGVVDGDPDELITTAAGRCGETGAFAGDGGPAALALLNRPYGIELDGDGNLYIADTLNNRIRVVYK